MQVRHCSAFGTGTGTPTRNIVHEHARDGWRLVQIFAPGVAAFGAAKYYELILEREMPENAMPSTTKHDAERVGI
jgi:Domain of unknown function (DUF4177)